MQSLALVIHVVLAIGVIGLVLLQHGKGADAGAAFGSGASATVFGARGSATFLTRATTGLAALFFVTSIFLFYLAANREGAVRSVTDIPGVVEEAPMSSPDLPGGINDPVQSTDLPAQPTSDVVDDAAGPAADPAGSAVCDNEGAAGSDLPQPAQ